MLLKYKRALRAVFLFWVIAAVDCGLLLRSGQRCSGNAVVKALQNNGSDGVAYCQALAGKGVTVTEMATTTEVSAETTVTSTTMMRPTRTVVEAEDVMVVVTALTGCNSPSDGTGDNSNGTAPATTDAVPARIGGRSLKAPTDLARFSSPQLASACGCLVVGHKRTVTGTTTVTSSTALVTELYTIMTGNVVHETSWILATQTNTVTSCTDRSATPTASDVPAP